MTILLSLYDAKTGNCIYTKSAKVVAQNRGLTSSSLTTVAKDTILNFVKTMFQ